MFQRPQNQLFELSQLTSVLSRDDEVSHFTVSKNGRAFLMVSRLGSLFSAHLSPTQDEPNNLQVHSIPWFEADDLQAQCTAFSPTEDFIVVATKDGSLFVLTTCQILPGWENPTKERDPNYREWASKPMNRIGGNEIQRVSSGQVKVRHSPTYLFWWTTQEFRSHLMIGTREGILVGVDLSNGSEVGHVKVSSSAIRHLDMITDNALDCSYLIITDHKRHQWRLLLDQRSTGYSWPPPNRGKSPEKSPVSPPKPTPPPTTTTSTPAPPTLNLTDANANVDECYSRSRLAGLKQMSVASLASIRQRLSEGKRMLDRRVGGSGSVDLGEEAIESPPGSPALRPESLASHVGDTFLSVQSTKDIQCFAGIFPDTAVLTIHNCELEVMPQTAYRLPQNTDRILILNKVMLTARKGNRDAVQIVSAHHAEINLDGARSRDQPVLQTFQLSANETILGIHKLVDQATEEAPKSAESSSSKSSLTESEGSSTPSQSKKTPFKAIMCVTQDNGQKNVAISQVKPDEASKAEEVNKEPTTKELKETVFKAREDATATFIADVKRRVGELKLKGDVLFQNSVVVTNKGIYLVRLKTDPVSVFLENVMRGEIRDAEQLALAFSLDAKDLLELAADIRLSEREFATAISLYRLSGCKHLKAVLKFAASGHVHELLSYLTVLFKTPNLEVTATDRIHLSNLALMAYFQQVLTKTPANRKAFQDQIKIFLEENQWYEESLAINMATETREWDVLHHFCRHRGLNHEMIDSIVGMIENSVGGTLKSDKLKDVSKLFQDMPGGERNSLLVCLLDSRNVEAVVGSPGLAQNLLKVLIGALPLLEEDGLLSVVRQSCPGKASFRPLLLPLLQDSSVTSTPKDFSTTLVNLFVTSVLLLQKKRSSVVFDAKLVKLIRPNIIPSKPCHRSGPMIAAGFNHVLLARKNTLTTWGCSVAGVLGHGAVSGRYFTPREVDFFNEDKSALKIRMCSVSAGRMHSVAMTDYGVYVWGSSKHGQLGLGKLRLNEKRPVFLAALKDVVQVCAGQYHTVALDSNGRVWTFGWGVHGQLGLGDIEDEFEPVRVPRIRNAIQVSAGYAHTLVLTSRGSVWVFGCGLFGQLGNGDTKKSAVPIRVELNGDPIERVSAGHFHNLAVSTEGRLYVWGCNPQVLRLEAQQRKKDRLMNAKKEGELNGGAGNGGGIFKDIKRQAKQALEDIKNYDGNSNIKEENGNAEQPQQPQPQPQPEVPQPEEEEDDTLAHMTPSLVDTTYVRGKITCVSGGNQHSMLLSNRGTVYTFGRNMDGQLGNNSRKESKAPTPVPSLIEDIVVGIAAGGDYSLAVTEAGTVFAWGNNAGGQLGKAPIEDTRGGNDGGKVLVMKTTRRIIRLQHNLQNSCDIPKPVGGIANGVYSESVGVLCTEARDCGPFAMYDGLEVAKQLSAYLHLTLEAFHQHLNTKQLIKKCLISDNPQAAAKIALLDNNHLQAFEFTLQASIKHPSANLSDRIFAAFLSYLLSTTASLSPSADCDENPESLERRQLLERLIACWQDQKFSFVQLEKLFLENAYPVLLQSLVITLFCPQEDRDTEHGPVLNEQSGPKLVDLFTPEFCLKIGDTFVKEIKAETTTSETLGRWLSKQRMIQQSQVKSETVTDLLPQAEVNP